MVQRAKDRRPGGRAAWDSETALDGLRVIGADEISYRRHHNYLTVIMDHASGQVVWAGVDPPLGRLLAIEEEAGRMRVAEPAP